MHHYQYYNVYGLEDRLPYLFESVECTSHEVHLSQCNHTKFNGDFSTIIFATECQIARESKLITLIAGNKCIIISHTAVPGAPQSVQISNTTSSTTTLTWSPPLVSERHGLSIFGYTINCSADHSLLGNILQYTDIHKATLVNLHPFTAYNCCVAASSSHGRGRHACARTVTCK